MSTEIFNFGKDDWSKVSEYQEFEKFSLFTSVSMNAKGPWFQGPGLKKLI